MAEQKKVLFFRDYEGFSGGHLKVWNYFNHFIARDYAPSISFSEQSLWDSNNPWFAAKDKVLSDIGAITPDIVFLAGMDWLRKPEIKNCPATTPIINLVQGIRHREPSTPLYSFLKNKAIRICVSEQVAEAIRQTQQVNGPVYTIPNGIDLPPLPQAMPFADRPIDILISGLKHGLLAQQLAESLRPLHKNVTVLTGYQSRADYLKQISQAKIAVFLPLHEEGFYLPPLEAMAMETLVICPDCIGNRSFCLPDYNCFRPQHDFVAILDSVHQAVSLSMHKRQQLLSNAKQTALKHNLHTEQQAFFEILDNLPNIW
ncbi:glycosyltransferase [Methylovulum psychrotolerans]|uniref:Uncharacterized protein n=1 Tax=Methylovulum psychrotolerans TaxID=1704499 RepID=A0A1Z4BXU8_9GAMM|nr:glycosyltransferase [Methylovulum psychrotolerans]ASF46105.1 hypothetical protein CEK71_08435 [Methylovulum psychrotolerans]